MSQAGNLSLVQKQTTWYVTYAIRTAHRPEVLDEMARILGINVQVEKGRPTVRMTGGSLDKAVQRVYPYLIAPRRQEYRQMVREAQARNAERDRRLAAAGLKSSTPEQRRKRAEAAYHSQDPAVVVIEDHFTPDMVSDLDLMMAAAQRAREAEEKRRMMAGHDMDYTRKAKTRRHK